MSETLSGVHKFELVRYIYIYLFMYISIYIYIYICVIVINRSEVYSGVIRTEARGR